MRCRVGVGDSVVIISNAALIFEIVVIKRHEVSVVMTGKKVREIG